MTTSPTYLPDFRLPLAMDVSITDDALVVELDDARTLSVPLEW